MKLKLKNVGHWMKARWLWILILVVVVGGLGWWQWSKSQSASSQAKFEKPLRETIERTIGAPGIVRAQQIARLRFLAGGKVTFVGAKEGDFVKKGQTLAVIDRATLQKQLEQNLNSYERIRYDWDNFLDKNKDAPTSNELNLTTKKSQTNLDDTVLTVEIQNIAINNTVLSAPFAGVLTKAPTTSAGVQLTGSDFFEVISPESMQVIARIDEADIAKIAIGQTAVIQLDAFRDAPITSAVSKIGFSSVETGSGTQYEVEFPLNADSIKQLRLGMNGDVTIKLGKSEDALTIPLLATRTRSGKTYVDVRIGDTDNTEERLIETGIETEERIEVISGLSENEEIAVPE